MGRTHPSHPNHQLELIKCQGKYYTCDGCKMQGSGKSYRCEECDFDLHKDCMFIKPTTSHKFFNNSTFKFFDRPPRKSKGNNLENPERYCDECGKRVKGFVYHCEETDLDMHPCCSNLKAELNIEGVEFLLCETVLANCMRCEKTKIKDGWSKIKGWSYVSKCEDCHIHVSCVMEMMAFKDGANSVNECLALENLQPRRSVGRLNSRNSRGRGKKFWRIIKVILTTIASILLGDPTVIISSLVVNSVVDLVSK